LDDPDFYLADPHAAFRWMRERAPVYRCERARLWAISKHADIMRVSRNPEIFCSARGILINDGLRGETPMEVPPSIIYMDPPQHNRYRKLVSRAFTPGMVAGLEGRTRAIARESLDAIRSGETHDFVETVAVPLPMLVIAEMLGVAAEDRGTFKRWSDAIIAAADTGTSPESMQHVGELFAYFYAKLGERRGRLLSALAAAEVDGERLADEELLMFCMTLLVAGNETTRNLISGGAKALMEFPDQRRALVENPDRLPGAVEEMLRWVTPIRSFARTATRDTEIRGQRIAAGDYVLLLYASGNRDEEVFGPTADVFDVARPAEPMHVAFGFGEHFCLGASLARLEARVLFEELLGRFPDFSLAGEIVPLRSTLMNGLVRMPVTFG
ncbi:MAG TPA: cytochrome P450, partial [Candidatus Binatus sp.]|nr:cytochrome P450 [Candidatus Binatus sp.]